jgi:hypothetical protein
MGQAIPTQHPAVVLRSHHRQLRGLLAVAMFAVVGLTIAVVILATDDDRDPGAGSASTPSALTPQEQHWSAYNEAVGALTPEQLAALSSSSSSSGSVAPGARYDGGPEEGTRGIVSAPHPGVRYDGGPNEGTAALIQRSAPATFDPNSIKSAPGVRYDGGPEEGTRGALSSTAAGTRYDGGPEEGSRGSGH